MSGFDLRALESVFLAIERTNLDVILVGGHAVSFYAAKYRERCPDLSPYLPLLSKDGDWIGTVDDGLRLAAALHLDWKANPRKGGMQGLSLGRIDMPRPTGAKIEILGRILGADAKEIRATAVTESARGFAIRVINPFLLYETKGVNLATIHQREGDGRRQDAKQFSVMGIIISELLREFAMTPGDERILVKSSGRLLDFCLTGDGAALVKSGAMDLSRLLPLDLMETHADASVQNFVNKGLPHFHRRLELALGKLSLEQTNKIRGDIEAMQLELGEQGRQADFVRERDRRLSSGGSIPEQPRRTRDQERGPEMGR